MTALQLSVVPVVKVHMLIRKPIAEVYEAFVDPAITSQFWFSHGSARLDAGKPVRWDWEWYDASADVSVLALEPNRRILIEWPGERGRNTVEWRFTAYDNTTFVEIDTTGFVGEGDQIVSEALDSQGGFTFVLAGCKAWLEHGVRLDIAPDHNPPSTNEQ